MIRLDGAHDTLVLLAHTQSMEPKIASYCMENDVSLSKVASIAIQGRIVTAESRIYSRFFKGNFNSLREIVLLWGAKDSQEMSRHKGQVVIKEVAMEGRELYRLLNDDVWKDKCFKSGSQHDCPDGRIEVKNGIMAWAELGK